MNSPLHAEILSDARTQAVGKRAVILDMDDTLIHCGKYYDQAKTDAANYLSRETGLDAKLIYNMLAEIDLKAISLPEPFSANRLPRSFEAAALAACHIAAPHRPSVVPYSRHMTAMADIAQQVFTAPYEEHEGVEDLLRTLRRAGYYLVLYTKGDRAVQERKIQLRGYGSLFDRIVITMYKTQDVLTRVTQDLGIDAAASWAIGDSLKDDITPAKAVGYNTIHVVGDHSWSYDNAAVTPDFTVQTIPELTQLFKTWTASEMDPLSGSATESVAA
jgi:putative hydrolase of the HAD superfamily